ncbi:phospholipase D-like domain-containing protein [Scleromatobacter humisilvae]|uniref:Phospholipase D-like domain-containing protein n=1 Tax=Scleromatobacter humisilvae TaxID=2897159 RepID=A0A9X1YKN7_9BURK|nr:phospholipase D-like domain-containing protein [Scleromatobacter humisilvae]MCK9686122.1 phospholipase D-like domain-containing protein [Scleromatobacter humisilvae]
MSAPVSLRLSPPAKLVPAKVAPLTAVHASHAHALVAGLGEPLVTGNRVDLLQDGPDTYAAMFEAIANARDHVNLESYILEADGPGEEFARRLIDKARAGVRVNVIYDSLGSLATPASFFDELRANGVNVCEYSPVRKLGNLLSRALHLRDHRKMMVVDGRIGFIGGVNISSVYSAGSSPLAAMGGSGPADGAADKPGWRDTHVRVEGPIVAQLQRLFMRHWSRHSEIALRGTHYFPPLAPVGSQRVALAACDAGRRRNPFYRALLSALDASQHRIFLTTAYLVPTRRLMRSLLRAARRGVDVHLLLPGVSDFWAPLQAGRSHYTRLLRAGIHLHELHDTLLHAKTCVIDGMWTTVGSSNLDWRSFLHNAEANLIALDAGLAQEMERVFMADVARSKEIVPAEWKKRGWRQRVVETIARRFEFFL